MVCMLVPFLLMIACSSSNWSYQYQGSSSNWQAVVDVLPNEQNGAIFVGKIKKLSDKEITNIHYEVDVTKTSQPAGNIDNPDFSKGYVELFQDIPNTEEYQKEFKNGVDEKEVKEFFGDYPVFHITWKDDQGEHTETLKLEFVQTK